jgi:uncharacterized protein
MMFEQIVESLRSSRGIAAKADIARVADQLGFTANDTIRVGDDCAAIPDGDGYLLLAIEGFINEFVAADPWFAGWCGVMVNVSDIAAMGGRPVAVVNAIWSAGDTAAEPILQGLRAASEPLLFHSSAATPTFAPIAHSYQWRSSAEPKDCSHRLMRNRATA